MDAHVIDFYQNQNVSHNMFGLVSVTVDQVSSILNSIIASKATGLDEPPARFIKDGSCKTSYSHCKLITTGTIPDDLKVARVVPSKIFERVVFNQLKYLLTEHKLLYIYFSLVFGRRIPLIHV